jgi:NAD+ diphosphatase
MNFVFRKNELLVRDEGTPFPSDVEIAPLLDASRRLEIGSLDGQPCTAIALQRGVDAPTGFSFSDLRMAFARLDERTWHMAGRALQFLEWDRTSRFCGACATPTERASGELAYACPACKLSVYPRLAPAVIVLVERENEALLAQPVRFPMFFSTLAGFAEPGETLEQTIDREIFEEVGVTVKEPRYFGSQPWPFPHSLMIGFHATYAGGELEIDPNEIGDARWFRFDALPTIPPKVSIARALIDDWVKRCTLSDRS